MGFNIFEEGHIIYCLIFFIVFIATLFVSGGKNRTVFFVLLVFLEFLIASLRRFDVGTDTFAYVNVLIPTIQDYSYLDLFRDPPQFVKEPVCYSFFKLISTPFETYTPYFFILQAVFWTLVGSTILKYSKDPLLSLFVFIAFRFSFFNLTAMRQMLALSITTFSYRFYVKKQMIPFFTTVIVASLFHHSALVFGVIYFVRNWGLFRKRWLVLVLAIGFLFVGYMFKSFGGFSDLADSGLRYAHYLSEDSGGNYFSICMTVILFSFYSLFIANGDKEGTEASYNIMVLALLFSFAGFFSGLFFRVGMYFCFVIPIIFSNAMCDMVDSEKKRRYFIVGMISMAVIFVLTGVAPGYHYHFYWDGCF